MTRIETVMQYIKQGITEGEWHAGAKIWSIRKATQELKVSKNTVTEAYDRLVASGWLEPRLGSGYYVPVKNHIRPLPKAVSVAQAVDAATLLREQLIRHYEVRVGEGRPPMAWVGALDFKAPKNSMDATHGYGNPWGYEKLRQYLAQALRERGVDTYTDNVLTTMGANHALDLVVRQYLDAGDTVLVDSPGYYPLFAKLHLMGVRMVGVNRLKNGPDIDDLQIKAAKYKPKIFFTQSQGHNPTGAGLSLAVGHRLLLAAAKFNFKVVEDDPFADILPYDTPRLVSLDQLDRVIYIGTFSKTLSAGLRVGYIVANSEIANSLCDLKMLTMASSGGITERMLYDFIVAGNYLKYLRKLRNQVNKATTKSLEIIDGLNLEVFCKPTGSFYLWVYLRPDENESLLVSKASEQNIFIAPGKLFIPDKQIARPAMRVNIAYASDQRFINFMKNRT